MSNAPRIRVKQDNRMRFETRTLDGQLVKPGDHKGGPENAVAVEITMSRVEEILNDLLEAVVGLLNASARMLKIERDTHVKKPMYDRQADVDMVSDNFLKDVKHHARTALLAARRHNTDDPVLRDARLMLSQFVKMLDRVKPAIDSSPGMKLASEWAVCHYLLVSNRSSDEDRTAGIARWRDALAEASRLIG